MSQDSISHSEPWDKALAILESMLSESDGAEWWEREARAAFVTLRDRLSYLEEQLEAAEQSVDRWKGWYEERQRQFVELQGWIEEYERFLAAMPDAGLSGDDPRSAWYAARPKYPDFRSTWRAVRAHESLQ